MSGLRPGKRKDTVSSTENDYEESYATIQFRVDYPTKSNQTLYILGNNDELGNWKEESAVKLIKLDSNSTIWESQLPIECPVGMAIQYKYLIIDSSNKKNYEQLPENSMRSITTKKPGHYIILNKKGELQAHISFIGKDKRSSKRKLSRMFFDTLNTKDFMNEGENIKNIKFSFKNSEDYSDFISSLSPEDLLSYENNKANFDEYDLIDGMNQSKDISENLNLNIDDRIIMVTLYLPISIKQKDINKKEFEIIEDENSFLSRYLNVLKNNDTVNLIWVGMLKNYFDFEKDDINIIDNLLQEKNYFMIRPDKKEWNLYLFYLERIMFPIYFNSSVSTDDEFLADNKIYYDAFYNINKSYYDIIKVNYTDNDFIILQSLALCFVPNLLMNKKPNTHIGLYIQEVLPSSDIIKAFPNYQEILKSILLCDVIGFQDFTSARNFLTIMKKFLGIFNEITKKGIISLSYLGRNIIVHIKQPPLTYEYIKTLTEDEEFKLLDKRYEKKYENNELTVISFDYLFILTAIFNKLKAIDLFLNSHKNLWDKCSFIMWIKAYEQNTQADFEEEVEDNSDEEEEEEEDSEDEEKEKINKKKVIKIKSELSVKQNSDLINQKMEKYKKKIEQEVSKIRKKYKNQNIITIKYIEGQNTPSFTIFKRLALFKHANIFLYPLFLKDQGIFVKEFFSMKNEKSKKYGAIVSENMPYMGTRSIVKVNPFDSDGILKALNQINGWSFNKVRLEADFKSIQKNNVENWIKSFVNDMKRIKLNDSDNKMKMGLGRDIAIIKLNKHFRQIKQDKLLKYFKGSKSRLLIFNYENTLINENDVKNLDNKNVSKRIVKIISSLCQDPNNTVFIISKYEHEILNNIFGSIPNLGICGDNGFCYKYPEMEEFTPLIHEVDNTWRETALKIMKLFSERTEGSKVIEKKSSIIFSYQNLDNYFGFEQADELKSHLSTILNTPNLDIVTLNSGSLEIKPKNVNKGAFLAKVLQDKYIEKKFDMMFIIGCDDTDEEMFKYLKSAVKYFHNFVKNVKIVSTTITKHMSSANYYFNEVNDCIENLEYIIKERNKEMNEGKNGKNNSFNRKSSRQLNEKENSGNTGPIFNFHDEEEEK